MSDWQLNTAVAFIIFNRPAVTERVFAEIAKAKPPKLLVIADGPRANRPGDAELCAATRAIIDRVDWNCDVRTNYSVVNLGCRYRVSSGLDWVFETVEEAIILEDDCLPHPAFFRFCEELLTKYRHDTRVAMIRGDNFPGTSLKDFDYRFSIYPGIWGWASWRRVWKKYDVDMKQWPGERNEAWLRDWLGSASVARVWERFFEKTFAGEIDTWDFQFIFAIWCQFQLSIIPRANLISNIGAGPDSTHVMDARNPRLNRKLEDLAFPLWHPVNVVRYGSHDAVGEKYAAVLERRMSHYVQHLICILETILRLKWFRYLKRFVNRVIGVQGERLRKF